MQSLSMNSPLRGLEKLSEDLRLERQKSNSALQERARLKIEVESLKQAIDGNLLDLSALKTTIESYEQENDSLKKTLLSTEQKLEKERHHVKDLHLNIESLNIDVAHKNYDIENLLKDVKEKVDIAIASDNITKSLESKVALKEGFIEELQNEIDQLRNLEAVAEAKISQLEIVATDRLFQITDLELKLKQADAITDNYYKLQISQNDLRREFEEILASNCDLTVKYNTANATIENLNKSNRNLEHDLEDFKLDCERFKRENVNLENTKDELMKRIKAEKESAEIAQTRADTAIRGRHFLEQQIEELRTSNLEFISKEAALENELAHFRSSSSSIQAELFSLREKSSVMDKVVAQSANSQAMIVEVDSLRAQLSEMRKQLLKKDVEEDAGAVAPRVVLERENQSRQVFEAIISELRGELDRVNSKCHDYQRKAGESASYVARIEQLEMEVQMYKDTAKLVSVESQSIAISASEALERNTKNQHDKLSIMRTLQNSENTLTNCQHDLQRTKDELLVERQKSKNAYLEKLTAERKSSELYTMKSRIEAELDDMKQQRGIDLIELEKSKRNLSKITLHNAQLQQKLVDFEKNHKEIEAKIAYEAAHNSELCGTQQDLLQQIQSLKYGKETLEREKLTLIQKLDNQRNNFDDLLIKMESLQQELSSMKSEKEMYKRDIILQETQRAEMHFQGFRQDLERTVSEYKEAERDRKNKDDTIRSMQLDLSKEKERSSLLKTQINLLDERLRVATKELTTYRSLDIYHNSLREELEMYRVVKESNSPNSMRESFLESRGAIDSRSMLDSNSPRVLNNRVFQQSPSNLLKRSGNMNASMQKESFETKFEDHTKIPGLGRLTVDDISTADRIGTPSYKSDWTYTPKDDKSRNTSLDCEIESKVNRYNQQPDVPVLQLVNNSTGFQSTKDDIKARRAEREKAREMSMRKEISAELSNKKTHSEFSPRSSVVGNGRDVRGKTSKTDFERAKRLLGMGDSI